MNRALFGFKTYFSFNEYGFRKSEQEEGRDRDMTAVKEDAMEQKAASEHRLVIYA